LIEQCEDCLSNLALQENSRILLQFKIYGIGQESNKLSTSFSGDKMAFLWCYTNRHNDTHNDDTLHDGLNYNIKLKKIFYYYVERH
jgi:hypothetical protein